MQDLIKYGESIKSLSTVNAKTGATTTRLLRAKEFKEQFKETNPDASNRDIKKAFEEYYKGGCKANIAGLAAKMTEGTLGVESFRVNADGDKLNVVFVDMTAKGDVDEVQAKLADMSADDLKKIMEYVSAKLA